MRLCITGTPGTGKTAVARQLAKQLGWKMIELNILAKENGLYCGYDKKRNVRIVDIGKVRREVGKRKEGNLILESHYAHDMPCDRIVVLRTHPRELRTRGASKGWPEAKIQENIQAEIMEVCSSEALESGAPVMEVDTTGKRPAAVARDIARTLHLG